MIGRYAIAGSLIAAGLLCAMGLSVSHGQLHGPTYALAQSDAGGSSDANGGSACGNSDANGGGACEGSNSGSGGTSDTGGIGGGGGVDQTTGLCADGTEPPCSAALCPDGSPVTYSLECYTAGENQTCTYVQDACPSAPTPSGTISAAPNPCTIPAGSGVCTSYISWSSTDASDAAVFVNGSLFAHTPSYTNDAAPWITPDGSTFDLHATNNVNDGQLLSSVSVTGECEAGSAWDPATRLCTISYTCPDGTPAPGNDPTKCAAPNPSVACTLTATPDSLSSPGTVTLSGHINTLLPITSWSGTLTQIGSVAGTSADGSWTVYAVDGTNTYNWSGTYDWFGIPFGSFNCYATANVATSATTCPDGSSAPGGDASACTCAQGNTAACQSGGSCQLPLRSTCSADGGSYSTTDSSGNVCGATVVCPYAAQGYTCIQNGATATCPLPSLPTVTFTAKPPLVHDGDSANAQWTVTYPISGDEPVTCAVTGPAGVIGSATGGNGFSDAVDTGPIHAQTTFTLNCVGAVDGAPLSPLTAVVGLIPTYIEK